MRKIAQVTMLLLMFMVLFIVKPSTALFAQTGIQIDSVCETDHEVKSDETLVYIAKLFYQDHILPQDAVDAIIEATENKAKLDSRYVKEINNKNNIQPGWILCIPSEEDARRILEWPDIIKIGVTQALTETMDTSDSIRDGIKQAVEEINDSGNLGKAKLEVVWVDMKGKPLDTLRGFDKLINKDQVVAIIDPMHSDSAFVLPWLAQQEGVPVVSTSNTAPSVTEIGSYIFSTALPDSNREADDLTPQAYTAVWALATAISDANSIDRVAVRDALDEMIITESPLGPFSFDQNGKAVHVSVIQEVNNGELTFKTINPDKIIKIGVAQDFSGDNFEPYGKPNRDGIKLAIKEINESGSLGEFVLEVIWEDTGGTPEQATEAFYKLINEDQVLAILGPTLSNSAFAANLLAQQAGVPVIASSNTAKGVTAIGNYIFRTSLPHSIVIPDLIRESKDKFGSHRVAVIYDEEDNFAVSAYYDFKQALEEQGLEIVATEMFKTGETDFSEQLNKIANEKPDTLVISALAEEFIEIIRQASQVLSEVRFITSDEINEEQLEQAGGAAEGLISGAAWNLDNEDNQNNASSQEFVEKYKEAYDTNPDLYAAQSYTAVLVLAEAIKQADYLTNRTAVRDALDNFKDPISSPLGTFKFDGDGDPEQDSFVVQVVKNGKWVRSAEISSCPQTSHLPKVIKVGGAYALTGDANVYGLSSKKGIDLAVKQINKRDYLGTIELKVSEKDTEGDKDQARKVFEELINNEKVVTIFGPTLSNSALETNPIAAKAEVPVIAISNTATEITEQKNVFRVSLPEIKTIPYAIQQVKELLPQIDKVAVIYDTKDKFATSGYEVFKEVLKKQKIDIVITETFERGEDDFLDQLEKIQKLNPDAIVVSALLSEGVEILKDAQEIGIEARFIGGNGFNTPELFKDEGHREAAKGLISGSAWISDSNDSASKEFIKAYKDEYDQEPDQFAAQAYSAVWILAKALCNANSADPSDIHDALAELNQDNPVENLPLGLFYFDENREPNHAQVVQKVAGDKFIEFSQ